MLGILTGCSTALDLLPSVAVACLVIAAVHLAFLMMRYAVPETASANHSPGIHTHVAAPTTTAAQAIETQATLDSATSLERRSLLSSPPSASCAKDLDIPLSVRRASDSAAQSGIPISAPRAPTPAADNHHISTAVDVAIHEVEVAGPSSRRLATGNGHLHQHPGVWQLPLVHKGSSPGNGDLYRPGSDPARFAPSSPVEVAQNAYLVSISDDYVAPLSTLRDSPDTADGKVDRTAAGPAPRQWELQPLPPVSSASEESSTSVSRSSSGSSAQGRQLVASAPSARGSTAGTTAAGPLEGRPAPAATSTQPKSRLDLATVRQHLQQRHGRVVDGDGDRCACLQHNPAPGGDSACKLQASAAVLAGASQVPGAAAAAAVQAPIVHVPAATASVRPRPSALYTSPMQHITVSVKVPNPYAPVTAHSLQNIVAQHVISAAAAQQPPQHTIMHMVSVPGCIQLLMSVVKWQAEQQQPQPAAELENFATPAEASVASAATPASPGLRDSVQSLTADVFGGANYVSNSVIAAPADAVATGPAPSWMVQAVCSAVQEFMRTHVTKLREEHGASADVSVFESAANNSSAPVGSCTAGTIPLQTPDTEQQQYQQQPAVKTIPVLIDINGQKLMMTPGPAGPAGPWQLRELHAAQEASNCCGPHADCAAATAASSAAQGSRALITHATASFPAATAAEAAAGDHEPVAAADGRWPLPEGVWAWPLCLPTADQGSGNSSGSSSVWQQSPAAIAKPVIAVHGLHGESVKLVVTDQTADVVADCTCQLSNGVARISPIASNSISRYTIYCVSQPDSPATAATASATQGLAVRFALPVLCLPLPVVAELHEAAREVMLEQSRARWLQLQYEPSAVSDAAEYYYYYVNDSASDSGDGVDGKSAPAADPVLDSGAAGAASVMLNVSSSSNDSGGGDNRHVGSFTTQRPQSRAAQAGGHESLLGDSVGNIERRSRHRRHHQHQLSSMPQQQAGKHDTGNGTDSGSSRVTFEEEDAEHYVSLRGRLFDGADVHQLLQQQFLAVLSDIGLLIDLTAAALQGRPPGVAAAGVTAITTAVAVSIGVSDGNMGSGLEQLPAAAAEPKQVTRIMASAVGQQLLTWAGGLRCWSCCQLVLLLLLDFGVELVMQDVNVGREHLVTAADVQALLLGTVPHATAVAAAADDPTAPAVSAISPLPGPPAAAMQLLPQQNTLSETATVTVKKNGPEAPCRDISSADVATATAAAAEQQRLHTLLEGRLSGVGSSESPMQWWGEAAHAISRGKTAADSSRARDQARAAAAAAIAGNMPGSAALIHKRVSCRAASEAGSSSAAVPTITGVKMSRAASGPLGLSVVAAGATEGAARDCGSSSSVPVATFPSVGPASEAAAAAVLLTRRAAVAAFDTAADNAHLEAAGRQQTTAQRKHQRMSIKDSASEMISRLMRRKPSSAAHREGCSAVDVGFEGAAATD